MILNIVLCLNIVLNIIHFLIFFFMLGRDNSLFLLFFYGNYKI